MRKIYHSGPVHGALSALRNFVSLFRLHNIFQLLCFFVRFTLLFANNTTKHEHYHIQTNEKTVFFHIHQCALCICACIFRCSRLTYTQILFFSLFFFSFLMFFCYFEVHMHAALLNLPFCFCM